MSDAITAMGYSQPIASSSVPLLVLVPRITPESIEFADGRRHN